MKNTLILFLSFLILSCNNKESYEIIGKVNNVPDGSIIKLFEFYGNMGVSFKADTVKNGEFKFQGTVKDTVADYYLRFPQNESFYGECQVWTENKKIFVTGDSRYLSNWIVKSKVKEQKNENRFLNKTRHLKYHLDSLVELWVLVIHGEIEGDLMSMNLKIDSVSTLLNETEFEIISKKPNNLSSIKRLKHIIEFNKTIPDSLLNLAYTSLSYEYKNTIYGKEILSLLVKEEPYQIGDKISDFNFYDKNIQKYQLSDLHGNYILLDFWSAGCQPCRLSIPELREFHIKHSNDILILGLNIDLSKDIWLEASSKDSITWANFNVPIYEPSSAYKRFGVRGIPSYYLIDSDLTLIHKWSGYRKGIFKDELSKFIEGI